MSIQAFPVPPSFMSATGDVSTATEGMTLRDYFAAKALQAFLLRPDIGSDMTVYCESAYRYADEMLAAREK